MFNHVNHNIINILKKVIRDCNLSAKNITLKYNCVGSNRKKEAN